MDQDLLLTVYVIFNNAPETQLEHKIVAPLLRYTVQ